MLESPPHFDQAKKLLLSSLPSMFQQHGDLACLPIPAVCPPKEAEVCGKLSPPISEAIVEEETLLNNDQSTTPIKKRERRIGGQSPIVEFEVRHSLRVKEKCQGFKQSQCSKVNCLACSLNPPTLSPELMKSIGTTICQIDPSKLEEGILSKKKKAKPIGKKKQKKDDNEEDKEEEDN